MIISGIIYSGDKMDNKSKMEVVVNAGLQAIPYIGGPLATLYFGYKQEQRFQRIEQTLKEVADELKGVKIPSIDEHNKDELIPLIDEATDKIENEHLEQKRVLYKNYIKGLLMTPTNGNYEERKLYLEVLSQITVLQIEIFIFLLNNNDTVDLCITKPGVDTSIIQSSIKQLESYGLVGSRLHSITMGNNNSTMPMILNVTEFGKRFHAFCLK